MTPRAHEGLRIGIGRSDSGRPADEIASRFRRPGRASLPWLLGLAALTLSFLAGNASAQAAAISAVRVVRGAESLPPVTPASIDTDLRNLALRQAWAPGDSIKMIPKRYYLNEKLVDAQSRAKVPASNKPDPLLEVQAAAPINKVVSAPLLNFAGGGFTGASPPDTVGDIGLNYYIQSSNSAGGSVFSVYNKETGALVAGPLNMDTLGTGNSALSNCLTGRGDPIVLYDQGAGRWLLSEFSDAGNKLCVYISKTTDPLAGGWWAYEFSAPQFPDYPKYAVWPDGYYIGTNEGAGPGLYALDRSKMLVGQAASLQRITGSRLNGFGFQMIHPADLDGASPPPTGTPAFFIRHNDDESHNPATNNPTSDFLEIFEYDVDFSNAANSTLTGPIQVPIQEFDSNLCGLSSFQCIPQPSGGIRLDPLREVVMWRVQYRNTGAYESMVGSHATDVDSTDHAGLRWWELRRSGGGPWTLAQEGTYAPDSHSRWMSSAATDQDGNLVIGYSTGSASLHAGIRYNGRLQADPPGTLTQGETILIAGTGVHSNERWGDYSSINVDPVDDCTFWYTNEHALANGTWATRIGKFRFESCGTPGIVLNATNLVQSFCSPGTLATITIDVASVGGFSGATTFSLPNLPAGFNASFTANPVSPPGQTTLTLSADASVNFNQYFVEILATAPGAESQSLMAQLHGFSQPPQEPVLLTPADGGGNVAQLAPFNWNPAFQAESFVLEVDDDPLFGSIDLTASGAGNSFIAESPLQPATLYHWRLFANNACGQTKTPARSFTTTQGSEFCTSPNLNLAFSTNSSASSNFVINQTGTMSGLDVSLNISHTWVGDAKFTLTHQDTGSSLVLIDRPGHSPTAGGFGCSRDDFLVTLSDEGLAAAEDQCSSVPPAAISGVLTPTESLSTLVGEELSGTWTLLAEDLQAGDNGVINSWCLIPVQAPEPGSIMLLGSGIMFILGGRAASRRRHKKTRAGLR